MVRRLDSSDMADRLAQKIQPQKRKPRLLLARKQKAISLQVAPFPKGQGREDARLLRLWKEGEGVIEPTITLKSSLDDPWPFTIKLNEAKLAIENFEALKNWFYRERLKLHPAGHIETRF